MIVVSHLPRMPLITTSLTLCAKMDAPHQYCLLSPVALMTNSSVQETVTLFSVNSINSKFNISPL